MMTRTIQFVLLFLITVNVTTSCKQSKASKEQIKKDVDVSIQKQIKTTNTISFDASYNQYFLAKYPKFSKISSDWNAFYKVRNNSFAWVDSGGLTIAANNLHNRLNNLNSSELNDSLPYHLEFNDIFEKANALVGTDFKDSILIEAEMMLTAQYLTYAKMLTQTIGTDELKKMGWNITQQPISYAEYLQNALKNNEDLLEKQPIYYQYNLLKKYLTQYKAIETAGGFVQIDTSIKKLLPNETHKGLPSIKAYLLQVSDLANKDTTNIFDQTTAAAIKQFRTRHGLKDTALINEDVIKQMKISVAQRIKQILVNMERCKWMPVNHENDYISVNIPDYSMNVYEKSKLKFSMNVVVGALATKTVIFSDTLKTVAFSPYWNVPYSIYKKDFAGRSAASLKRKNMEITGPNSVRQLPGPDNALGKVKFLFPNNYNIYFHDTNAKDKFNFTQRAFSHGCIRLSEPKKLATYLLRNEPTYTEKVIDSLMNKRKETQVKLKQSIPVIIGYFTSFVNTSTNLLQFRKDIYSYDDKVLDGIVKK